MHLQESGNGPGLEVKCGEPMRSDYGARAAGKAAGAGIYPSGKGKSIGGGAKQLKG